MANPIVDVLAQGSQDGFMVLQAIGGITVSSCELPGPAAMDTGGLGRIVNSEAVHCVIVQYIRWTLETV